MNVEPPSIVHEMSKAGIGFPIKDVIAIDPAYGLGVSGIVLILEDFQPADPNSLIGTSAEIRLHGGWTLSGEVAAVRDHGPTSSILLENWPDGFPRPVIGWRVEIPAARVLRETSHE